MTLKDPRGEDNRGRLFDCDEQRDHLIEKVWAATQILKKVGCSGGDIPNLAYLRTRLNDVLNILTDSLEKVGRDPASLLSLEEAKESNRYGR